MSTAPGTVTAAGTYTSRPPWYNGASLPAYAYLSRIKCGDFYRTYGKHSGFVGIGRVRIPAIGATHDVAMMTDTANTVASPVTWSIDSVTEVPGSPGSGQVTISGHTATKDELLCDILTSPGNAPVKTGSPVVIDKLSHTFSAVITGLGTGAMYAKIYPSNPKSGIGTEITGVFTLT